MVALPKNQLNNILRVLLNGQIDRVQQIRHVTFGLLKKLKVTRDLTKAIRKPPKGSDQVDVGSIITWLNKIVVTDKLAVKQLVVIDATACKRMDG